MNLSVNNDLLILEASFSRSPSAPDAACLFQVYLYEGIGTSLGTVSCETSQVIDLPFGPARSTRSSLANRELHMESFSHLLSIVHVNTVCERLLTEFMFVADTFLFPELCGRFQAYAIS
jgi:hypothetical protein